MYERADPFAPLTDSEKASTSGSSAVDPEVWEPQLPAPGEPPQLELVPEWSGQKAIRRSVYRSADGAALFAVYRFPAEDCGKVDIPYTYGRRLWTDRNGRQHNKTDWHFKRPKSPVPLYGLNRLTAMPDASVLIVEGEKKADAAAALFPDLVPIASQGGCNNGHTADWTPLRGRRVVLWPDNDQPGREYAEAVAQLLTGIAVDVRRVVVPEDWPEGWDLANDAPDSADLRGMLAAAVSASPVPNLPMGYSINEKGLSYTMAATDRKQAETIWLCAPVIIVCETDDGAGNGHGIVLQWRDRRGRLHQRVVPRSACDVKNGFINELMDAGLRRNPSGTAQTYLRMFLGLASSPSWRQTVNRTGWHEVEGRSCFVLSNAEAIGPCRDAVVLSSDLANTEALFAPAGTLTDWQDDVARFGVGNDRLALFISGAFAGPLLDVMCEDSGGVHLVGKSQSGKSTALVAAASVWGKGAIDGGFVRTWRATMNGMEGTAAAYNDAFLPLDEIGMASGREVGEIVYSLANQSGKARAGRTGALRKVRTWKLVFCSTGEVSLATKMMEQGVSPMAGQEARLVSLPADAGVGLGVFQQLHGFASAADLVASLKKAASKYFGTAGRAFLHALTEELARSPRDFRAELEEAVARFLLENAPAGADGQVLSVGRRFGLFAAAGELAAFYGVLPWPDGKATRAASACFHSWMNDRGGERAAEDMQGFAAVKLFVELHGASRFTTIGERTPEEMGSFGSTESVDDRPIVKRAGWRKRNGDNWMYLFSTEVWRTEVCKGLHPDQVARELERRGYLTRDGKHWTKQHLSNTASPMKGGSVSSPSVARLSARRQSDAPPTDHESCHQE